MIVGVHTELEFHTERHGNNREVGRRDDLLRRV